MKSTIKKPYFKSTQNCFEKLKQQREDEIAWLEMFLADCDYQLDVNDVKGYIQERLAQLRVARNEIHT